MTSNIPAYLNWVLVLCRVGIRREEDSIQLTLFECSVDLLSVPDPQHPIKGIRDAIKKVMPCSELPVVLSAANCMSIFPPFNNDATIS